MFLCGWCVDVAGMFVLMMVGLEDGLCRVMVLFICPNSRGRSH